ncbi:MAG: cell division protein SepF [Erysipelotrichaceae bacterium]|nr:cell division protein SepF [Erysipelotrichaceae bacterium]
MGFMDKIHEFVNPIDEEDEEYEVEEAEVKEEVTEAPAAETTARYERPKPRANSGMSANTKMVLFEPRGFGEIEEVGMRLKEGRAVVVNLHKMDRDYAQRTIDFLTGVTFALDGKNQKIGQNVILCSPAQIGVVGQISLGDPDDFDEE